MHSQQFKAHFAAVLEHVPQLEGARFWSRANKAAAVVSENQRKETHGNSVFADRNRQGSEIPKVRPRGAFST